MIKLNSTGGKMKDKEQVQENRKFIITFRVFQAIFFGVLALGVSSGLGDLGNAFNSPFSTFSITTTVFGIIGSIITGTLANKSKDW